MKRSLLSLATFFLVVVILLTACEKKPVKIGVIMPFEGVNETYVDSVLEEMSLQEKLGQLIIWKPKQIDSASQHYIFQQIEKGRVGGVIMTGMELRDYLDAVDTCLRYSSLPFFLGTNEKISLHNQFQGLTKFPQPVTLAALDSAEVDEVLEEHYFQQSIALGQNLNFQITLKRRSQNEDGFDYGVVCSSQEQVAEKSQRIFNQSQKHRILSILDSYESTALIESDTIRDSIFANYLALTRNGLSGMLVADHVFKNDTIRKQPSRFLKNYLSEKFDFNGLLVAKLNRLENPAEKMRQGIDLLVTEDGPTVYYSLLKLLERGKLTERDLNRKVRQILMAKAWVNEGSLQIKRPITAEQPQVTVNDSIQIQQSDSILQKPSKADTLEEYFRNESWRIFTRDIFEKSIVILRNPGKILPVSNDLTQQIQVFEYTDDSLTRFESMIQKFAYCHTNLIDPGPALYLPLPDIKKPDEEPVLVFVFDRLKIDTALHEAFLEKLAELSSQFKTVLVNFGDPENINYFPEGTAIIHSFEKNDFAEQYVAQMLFGAVASHGKLPGGLCFLFPVKTGILKNPVRLGYAEPELEGIKSSAFRKVSALAYSAIEQEVFPGCQIVFARKGKIVYSKSFGSHTYGGKQPVRNTDLYDIASITKVLGTTLSIMKLNDRGKMDLDETLGAYLPKASGKDIGAFTIRELLYHTTGLPPLLPISGLTRVNSVPNRGFNDNFSRKKKKGYEIRIADNVYFKDEIRDSIWAKVYRLSLPSRKRYRYGDINFFLLQKAAENLSVSSLDAGLQKSFYTPLGLKYTTFKPLSRFSKNQIVPTENDRKWRKNLVHGYVHDPSAALMGGVAGNAGLFSNAENVAVVFQMLLNDGAYGSERYFNEKTVSVFTSEKRAIHRGLGFDMTGNKRYPAYSKFASRKTFGHTGYTGTCVWADPANQTIFVFLSNRVYPSSSNGKIFSKAIRSRIHSLFYDAIDTYKMELPVINEKSID
jgi:beta-N-acetylhexosaminidase